MKLILAHVLLMALLLTHAAATASVVDSLDALSRTFSSLAPGSVIEVADGTYTTKGGIKIVGKKGTLEQPIVLRAQHRGKAVIAGTAGFILRQCDHVIIEGFAFEHDAD